MLSNSNIVNFDIYKYSNDSITTPIEKYINDFYDQHIKNVIFFISAFKKAETDELRMEYKFSDDLFKKLNPPIQKGKTPIELNNK